MAFFTSPLTYFGFYCLGYLMISGTAYLLTRQQRRVMSSAQIRREIKYSLISQFIYGLITLFALKILEPRGLLRVYSTMEERSYAWYFASFIVVLLLHDAYFYWTHRWMHHPKIFRPFHLLHHESIYTTPFTSHAFDIPEGVVQGLFFLLIALFLPVHWTIIPIFFSLSMMNNVYGHLGYDFLGRLKHRFPFTFLNDPSSHGWHHVQVDGNYSVYFNFWDRIMGTWRGHLEPTATNKRPDIH